MKPTLACAMVVVLLVQLLCGWTASAVNTPLFVSGTESARHAHGAGEGETPRPVVEQELVLKKRRNQLSEEQRQGVPAKSDPAEIFLLQDPDRRLLDTIARLAHHRYGLARRLRLSDPALRLHPGHAPPENLSGISG